MLICGLEVLAWSWYRTEIVAANAVWCGLAFGLFVRFSLGLHLL